MTQTPVQDKVFTIPNVLSASRLVILLPLSLYLLATHRYAGTLVALFFLGVTDWLDGYLARALNQQSELGKYMDVVADRISVIFIALGLVFAGMVPWWVVCVIAGVDAIVAATAWFLFHGPPDIEVSFVGKVRTMLLLFALPGVILAAELDSPLVTEASYVLLAIGLVFHVVAAVGYVRAMVHNKPGKNVRQD